MPERTRHTMGKRCLAPPWRAARRPSPARASQPHPEVPKGRGYARQKYKTNPSAPSRVRAARGEGRANPSGTVGSRTCGRLAETGDDHERASRRRRCDAPLARTNPTSTSGGPPRTARNRRANPTDPAISTTCALAGRLAPLRLTRRRPHLELHCGPPEFDCRMSRKTSGEPERGRAGAEGRDSCGRTRRAPRGGAQKTPSEPEKFWNIKDLAFSRRLPAARPAPYPVGCQRAGTKRKPSAPSAM
jgi:hypothetical protein